jgi:hypothetical protein
MIAKQREVSGRGRVVGMFLRVHGNVGIVKGMIDWRDIAILVISDQGKNIIGK